MAKEKKTTIDANEVPKSLAREEFARLIEVYKAQNPVKYQAKRVALEKKLASL